MELVKPNGRVISGLPCIYHLGGGVTFFCESPQEDGDSYIFSPEKTVWLAIQPPGPTGQQQIGFVKGFGPAIPFQPSTLRVGKAGVMVTDCTDPNILKLARQTLSGIVIAPAGAAVPPGERVH